MHWCIGALGHWGMLWGIGACFGALGHWGLLWGIGACFGALVHCALCIIVLCASLCFRALCPPGASCFVHDYERPDEHIGRYWEIWDLISICDPSSTLASPGW